MHHDICRGSATDISASAHVILRWRPHFFGILAHGVCSHRCLLLLELLLLLLGAFRNLGRCTTLLDE